MEARMLMPFHASEYLLKASFDYWIAVCYPSIYLARFL